MDGMAAMFDDRPAIVIAKNHKHNAWLSFILAHELGHIVLGHTSSAPFVFDEHVTTDTHSQEEQQANRFAVELLTGNEEMSYTSDLRLTGKMLAEAAKKTGLRDHVDPGVVALNYAFQEKFIPIGQAALNHLYPQSAAPDVVRKTMRQRLDWEELSEETANYLRRVCGLKDEE